MNKMQRQMMEKKKRNLIMDNHNTTTGIYSDCIFTKNISVPITLIGKDEKEVLLEIVKRRFEGKCIVEGYVKPNSMKIITISSGKIERGSFVSFEVTIQCKVCLLVEGMIVSCKAINITKAGIRAEIPNENPSPLVIYISRDYDVNKESFQKVKEGDILNVRIIGQQFELNSTFISVIAGIA
jgi:DNA-directed RNA polymerase subunit E'/Rpb7